MKIGLGLLKILIAIMSYSTLFGQEAVQTTPCELAADPAAYDRKFVTVRSPVLIEFEGSGFDVNCKNGDSNGIWITFGGDVEMPIVYCCGDHTRKKGVTVSVEGIEVPLRKDDEFKRFFRLLTAERKTAPTGVPCFYDCYQNRVTATLTGQFFAGEARNRPSDGKVSYWGYGHMGCCSLFVIQRVSEVDSEPTGIPIGDNFDCQHQTLQLPIDHSVIIAKQKAVLNRMVDQPVIEEVGEKLIRERMRNKHHQFEVGDNSTDYEGKFEHEKKSTYMWLAKDKLTSYSVAFERFDWLSRYASKIEDRIWTAVKVERSECKPKM